MAGGRGRETECEKIRHQCRVSVEVHHINHQPYGFSDTFEIIILKRRICQAEQKSKYVLFLDHLTFP